MSLNFFVIIIALFAASFSFACDQKLSGKKDLKTVSAKNKSARIPANVEKKDQQQIEKLDNSKKATKPISYSIAY